MSIREHQPTAADFDGNRLEMGHARFSILGEAGEITTGALLFVEYARKDRQGEVPWRLVVVPRPAITTLGEDMGKLVLADSGEAIRGRAEGGNSVFNRTTGT